MTTESATRLLDILNRFETKHVVVVGDFVADEYLYCNTSRISREAPAALVLTYQERELCLGGGANAAANLRSLAGVVSAVGLLGDDPAGLELYELMGELGIERDAVLLSRDASTVVKTRIMTSTYHSVKQQVLRVDREHALPKDSELWERHKANLLKVVEEKADALLIADYGYGSAAPELMDTAITLARQKGIPVTLDSRHRMLEFQQVSAATPNEPEAEEALGHTLEAGDAGVVRAGETLRKGLGAEAVLITLGSRGMALIEREQQAQLIDVYGSDEIADVTGAGDTVIATFSLALAAGASYADAACLANYAGGLVVMKRGTATNTRAELQSAIQADIG